MNLRNTTNIDSKLIQAIFSFVCPDEDIGTHIKEIRVRNKKENHIHGTLGWHKPSEGYISVILPRAWKPAVRTLKYSKRKIYVHDRVECLVETLAHELRHAWQFKQLPSLYRNRRLAELDAEAYATNMLTKWQQFVSEAKMAKAASFSRES